MTDLKSLFAEAEQAGKRVEDVESKIDDIDGDLTNAYHDAEIAIRGGTAPEALIAARDALKTIRDAVRELSRMAGKVQGDISDLAIGLDKAQYEQHDTADLAEMIRDVERGIRDPCELRYAIERIEPNYVL
jgi:hypothetical protein